MDGCRVVTISGGAGDYFRDVTKLIDDIEQVTYRIWSAYGYTSTTPTGQGLDDDRTAGTQGI